MIEVVRSRLDARERHRWKRALAQTPILAARAPRARGPFMVSVASTCLTVAMLVLIAAEGAWDRGQAALGALTAGGLVLVAHVGAWMWREARSEWPSGRFLFAWGYVEVEHDRLRYVDARVIEATLVEDGVTLSAPGWSTTFRGDIDAAMLAPLAAPAAPEDGYREGPWFVVGAEVAPPLVSSRAKLALWIAAIAAAGAIAGEAARAARTAPVARGNPGTGEIAPTARMPSRVHRF